MGYEAFQKKENDFFEEMKKMISEKAEQLDSEEKSFLETATPAQKKEAEEKAEATMKKFEEAAQKIQQLFKAAWKKQSEAQAKESHRGDSEEQSRSCGAEARESFSGVSVPAMRV